jgi:hypothetical protein
MNNQAATPLFVGHFFDGKAWQLLPVSDRDLRRSIKFYSALFDSFSIKPEHEGALILSCYDDWAMTVPLESALTANRIRIYNADSTPFEAQRIETFIRRFSPPWIIGVNDDVMQGLQTAGFDLKQLFGGRFVWVRDTASYQSLQALDADVKVLRWQMIGPAIGMECAYGSGLHIDDLTWQLRSDDGEIIVESNLHRDGYSKAHKTGVYGQIDFGTCACGSSAPRVLINCGAKQN